MPIEIDQIIRSKRKTIALIVNPDASVIVRAPLRTSNQLIQEYVAKNVQWIEKKQAEARALVPPVPKQYVAGESFEYLGIAYPLEIVKDQKQRLHLEDGKFKLSESVLDNAESAFERWYRQQARQILNEQVEFYACQHGFKYKTIGITSARTCWGSCSANRSLNFSWRLIQAPSQAVDYVVVHELVHTVFHNHSKKFWKRVEQILPDYKEQQKWLRKNGQHLMI